MYRDNVYKEKLEYLRNFHNELLSNRKLDKQAILSLEEFVGENVVTSKVNMNKVSNTPRDIMVDEVKSVVETKVKEMEEASALPTFQEYYQLLKQVESSVLPFLRGIMSKFVPYRFDKEKCSRVFEYNQDIIDAIVAALTSEKLKYRYKEEELIDITTLPLDAIYSSYKDYITEVHNEFLKEPLDPEFFVSLPQEATPTSVCPYYNFLLMLKGLDAIKCDSGCDQMDRLGNATREMIPKPITVQDIVSICINSKNIIAYLECITNTINEYLRSSTTDNYVNNTVMNVFDRFKNISNPYHVWQDGNVVDTCVDLLLKENKIIRIL